VPQEKRYRREQAGNAEFAGDVAFVGVEALLVVIELRPAEAEFIDERRAERADV